MQNRQDINVIELRNYLLRPGKTDEFIRYFEDHFIDSQHELKGYVLGEYKIDGKPDRFCWIRGFENMTERSRFLPEFYDGEIWKEQGPAANAMMLEWHHVHLLKPAFNDQIIDPATFGKLNEIVVIEFYRSKEGLLNELISFFNTNCVPLLKNTPAEHACYWITETMENDFPRLPVIQDEQLFVSITSYENEETFRQTRDHLAADNRLGLQEFLSDYENIILHPAHA